MQSQPGVGSRTEEPCRQLRACVLAQCPDAALVNQHKSFPKRTKDERIARAAGRTDENMAPRLPDELAQLRALLPQVLSLIRSRRAALEAEFADLGGHAPAAANSTEPSATGLGCEESPALQQLIRRTLSDWYRERSAFEAAIVGAREFDCAGKYYYQQFLAPEEASALMECLVAERPPYMVKFNEAWRSTVATRPKCNMAQPVDGAWPAYKWGQVADDLPLIELPPRLVQDLARRLEEHFGHPRGFLNSPMATYYYDGKHQYLVCHQDKAHSCESTGQIETAAPIYNLSLGAPRNFVIADLNSLGKFRRVDMRIYADIRMNSGDLVVLSPEMSARFCHGVPEDPDAPAALRISLVFRHCTKYWIRQLPDKTWEQCRRGADGQDGPWKPLIGPKDGESDDREARLTERRRIAAAKLSNQHTQKRGKRKRSTSSQPPGAPAPQAARRRVTGGCSAGTGGDKSRPVTLEAEADCDLEEPMDCEELAAPQPPKCPRISGDSSGGPGAAAGAVAASVEAAPVCATKRLAAFVHACGADGAKKLHGEGVRFAPFAGTEEFERHPDWQSHQRLEVNTRLDGASRDLVFTARADTDVVKLQKALLTRTLLNKRGARADVEEAYRADVGRSFYDGAVEEDAFSQSLLGVQLDDACSGMRRVQWTAEAKKQGKPGKQAQRKVCAALWARLRREDAFGAALARLANGDALGGVLAETLAVHSSFLRMLVARDLAVLLPDLVTQTDVDACTVVGGGAEATLAECTEGPTDGAADSKGK